MNKFNEIDINIKKALITSINVELKNNSKVEVTINGSLLTQQNKTVSSFWFNTSSYISEDKQIEIPFHIHDLIGKIFKELTPIIYQKLNDTYKQIGEIPKDNKSEATIVDEDIPF